MQGKQGKVVVISGPSGVGKTTICREVVKRVKNAYLSVSVTTRPKAAGEVEGEDYRFISKEEFAKRIGSGSFLEYAEVFGNLYGTPIDTIEEALAAGKIVILEIDVQGAKQAKIVYSDAEMIFIFPPSQKELVGRMSLRGREDAKAAGRRLGEADREMAAALQYYQHQVINDELSQAVSEVIQIIQRSTGEKEC